MSQTQCRNVHTVWNLIKLCKSDDSCETDSRQVLGLFPQSHSGPRGVSITCSLLSVWTHPSLSQFWFLQSIQIRNRSNIQLLLFGVTNVRLLMLSVSWSVSVSTDNRRNTIQPGLECWCCTVCPPDGALQVSCSNSKQLLGAEHKRVNEQRQSRTCRWCPHSKGRWVEPVGSFLSERSDVWADFLASETWRQRRFSRVHMWLTETWGEIKAHQSHTWKRQRRKCFTSVWNHPTATSVHICAQSLPESPVSLERCSISVSVWTAYHARLLRLELLFWNSHRKSQRSGSYC